MGPGTAMEDEQDISANLRIHYLLHILGRLLLSLEHSYTSFGRIISAESSVGPASVESDLVNSVLLQP